MIELLWKEVKASEKSDAGYDLWVDGVKTGWEVRDTSRYCQGRWCAFFRDARSTSFKQFSASESDVKERIEREYLKSVGLYEDLEPPKPLFSPR